MQLTITVGSQIRDVLLRFTTTELPEKMVSQAKQPVISRLPRGMTVFEMTSRNYSLKSLLEDLEKLGFRLENASVFHRDANPRAPTSSRYAVHFHLTRDAKKKIAAESARESFASLAEAGEKWRVMAHINPVEERGKLVQGLSLSINFSFRATIGNQPVDDLRAEAAPA